MKQGADSQSSFSTYAYIAIRVALILAIICIAVNTWVLWNVYSDRNNVVDPTLAAIESLGDGLGGQISSINQRLLLLEQKVLGLSAVPVAAEGSEEIAAALDQLSALFTAYQAQPEYLTEIMGAITALEHSLEQSIEEKHAIVISAIADLEQRLNLSPNMANTQRQNNLISLTVKRGDTIWELASQFEDPPSKGFIDRIMEYNMISDPTRLQVGQKIIIPQS